MGGASPFLCTGASQRVGFKGRKGNQTLFGDPERKGLAFFSGSLKLTSS